MINFFKKPKNTDKTIKKKENLVEVISFNSLDVFVTYVFSSRKSISIEVHPNLTVKVRSPNSATLKYLRNSVNLRHDWIEAKIKKYQLDSIPQFNYQNGETLYLQGHPYEFAVVKSLVNKVFLKDNVIELNLISITDEKIKKHFDVWYRKLSERIISNRFEKCEEYAEKIGLRHEGHLSFRKMKRRWGSCSNDGNIMFNYDLVKAPTKSIDYVILHELCHLQEFNHSREFYSLLSKLMPDWRLHKQELNRYIM
jgi:hypothetical protein